MVLRAIVTETSIQSNGGNIINAADYNSRTASKRNSASMWESLNRKKGKLLSPEFDNWEDIDTFIAALKKIESWIFSRIVECIWWQVCFLFSLNSLLHIHFLQDLVKFYAPIFLLCRHSHHICSLLI